MSSFRFADPEWVHGMWLVLGMVAALIWFDHRGGAALERFLSRPMQKRLVRRLSAGRRWLSIALLGLSTTALVVALMRPQWGLSYVSTPRVGTQIMVCLDVSKSMLAEDTAPNRLERAKAELTDLLTYLEGDQVGLIAFAGRASVLCPLTPDFGFYRLILEAAGPHSVGRGGTRLEEPIRKALAGFRSESNVSRTLLLITDGEDHDSFPVDAAKAAAERGIKIIAIGFGDEAGSQVPITDPETGVRSLLRDSDGNPVVSRLDGETLRELALITEGAYIPAGTGTLDLASIYQTHLAALVRGQLNERGHAVRRDGFQWAVLSGLLLLVGALIAASGPASHRAMHLDVSASSAPRAQAVAALLFVLLVVGASNAQQDAPRKTSGNAAAAPSEKAHAEPSSDRQAASDDRAEEQVDPRTSYNEALALLDTELDRAESLFTRARRDSKTDGEVRFRATYNMGWVQIKRADENLQDNPHEALEHLRSAAGWFGDAIRLRPEYQDARHNYEVVMRRAMELADSLAKQDGNNLEQQLDQLLENQRQLLADISPVVQRVAARDDPNAADQFRSEFRGLAVQQRTILSDSQSLTKTAREELDSLRSNKKEEQNPEDRLRAAQLTNLLHYANRANQHMGQARSQIRRRQGERAYRRASAALTELKRARDQLRDPVQVLGVLLADASTLAQFTSLWAGSTELTPGAPADTRPVPAWLSHPYLEETQQALTERTAELEARLKAGLQEQDSQPLGPAAPNEEPPDPQAARFLAMVRVATPFITEAKEAFEAAFEALTAKAGDVASQRQVEAIVALREARERFLDLQGLIELTYAREARIQGLLAYQQELPRELVGQFVTLTRALQEQNIPRCDRLDRLIEDELGALSAHDSAPSTQPVAAPNAAHNSQQQSQAPAQRLTLAQELVEKARSEMKAAISALDKLDPEGTAAETVEPLPAAVDPAAVGEVRRAVDGAVEHLQSLRRLFFSIVQHLRETAQRQTELNDESERVAVLAEDEEIAVQTGPLAARQYELASMSGQIATALKEQSQQNPADSAAAGAASAQQHLQQAGMQLAQAAELVGAAGRAMEEAGQKMAAETPELKSARPLQDEALEKLIEALALLVPPEQRQQQQQDQEQQQQDQGQDQQQQAGQDEQQQEQEEARSDPARLLQSVRDREARRLQENARRQRAPNEPVEKDW